jgi:hypothetical protein
LKCNIRNGKRIQISRPSEPARVTPTACLPRGRGETQRRPS